MRVLLLGSVVLSLAACSGKTEYLPQPQTVSLGGDHMKVRFSDGLVCRTSVPLTGGQGRLAGCANPLSWSITIQKRNPLEQVFGEAVSPYAMIVLSDTAGQSWTFETPVPVGRDGRK